MWGETQDYTVTVMDDSTELEDVRPSHCTASNVSASGFKIFGTTLSERRVRASFHYYATENLTPETYLKLFSLSESEGFFYANSYLHRPNPIVCDIV